MSTRSQSGYAYENDVFVPTVTETPLDALMRTEEAAMPAADDAASKPRRHEWLRIVQWPATFLAGVVNTKSAKLSQKVIRALALRGLLLISVRDRELLGADIAHLLDIAPATVTRHGNILIEQLGSTAIVPGKRSKQTRKRCSIAKKRKAEK